MVSLDNYTPDLIEIIEDAIEERLFNLHTGLPAKVVTFNATEGTCSVQPLLKRVFLDDNEQELVLDMPQITNVPIIYPAGGGWSITWPLAPEDTVYLAFAERSIAKWQDAQSGLTVDPVQSTKHDLNDAICIPALRPRTNPLGNLSTTDLTLGREDGSNQIVLKANGTIELGTAPTEAAVLGNELLAYLQGLVTIFNAHVHPGVGSTATPQTPPSSTLLSTVVKVK